MSDDAFKLPGSSYEELTKIIKAYGHQRGPAGPGDVAKLASIDPTQVSRNNKFLVGAGIIEGGNKKSVTSIGQSLATALDHDMTEEIRAGWLEVVDSTDFLSDLVKAVRIRRTMDPEAFRAHVAYSAGLPNKPSVKTGAGTIIDLLLTSGTVAMSDGQLVAVENPGTPTSAPRQDAFTAPPNPPVKPQMVSAQVPVHGTGAVSINVEVRVQCKPEDVEALGVSLRKMLEELGRGNGEEQA